LSKFHDDSFEADDAIDIGLSREKLRALDADMFEKEVVSHDLIHEHLGLGDTCSAVVACLDPLLVAAYSFDLDCVVMLSFPNFLIDEYRLSVGSRLLTVNTYTTAHGYASDLTPGSDATGLFTGFFPIIAEFVSDDLPAIEARKIEIEEEDWRYVQALAAAYLDEHGKSYARNGHPYESELEVGEVRHSPVVILGTIVVTALAMCAAGGYVGNQWSKGNVWAITGGAIAGLAIGAWAGLLIVGWVFVGRIPERDGQSAQ